MSKEKATQPAEEQAQPAVETYEQDAQHKVELTVVDGQGEESPVSSVKTARFAPLTPGPVSAESGSMDLLLDVDLDVTVELGRTMLPMREILQLGPGSIVELEKMSGEPVDVMVNGKLIARGEVVVVDENFGVRVTEIASRNERLSRLA